MSAAAADPSIDPSLHRIDILDGWRAVSILMVLSGHLLPLGPKSWELNGAFAGGGMAIFFTLSGLLITRFLLERPDVIDFLIRRFFRILPLAWVAMAVLAIANKADAVTVAANFLFVANLPPSHLFRGGDPLWSLCVEVQFYVAIAIIVWLGGRRALYVLPAACLAVTAARVATGNLSSIFTWYRIDEILAGVTLALIINNAAARKFLSRIPSMTTVIAMPLLIASAHDQAGALNYLRPYMAAVTVGSSIFAAPTLLRSVLQSRAAKYIADTSYALYVFHGMLVVTWLGTGDLLFKYLKRPLLFAATFGLAHYSTFHFERPMIAFGKSISRRRQRSRAAQGVL